jgi:predicted transposase/invertase (TIGR01784 family)
MSKSINRTPHDDFFKVIMDVKENVTEFIKSSLPEDMISKIDFDSLQNCNASYTDGKIGNYRADMVYKCRYDNEEDLTITFLFEHKSYKSELAHFQMLAYIAAVYLSQIRNGEKPSPVVPILFYHGQRKWEYKGFFEHFKGGKVHPDLKRFSPGFDYVFANLQEKGDQWISEQINSTHLRISFLLMRNIRSDELLDKLAFIFDGIEELLKTDEGRRKYDQIYLYLKYGSKEPDEKIKEVMDHATYMSRPIPVGSTAWQIVQKTRVDAKAEGIAEGKAEGIAEGIAEGKAEEKVQTAINLLRDGFDIDVIARITKLDSAAIEKLKKENL